MGFIVGSCITAVVEVTALNNGVQERGIFACALADVISLLRRPVQGLDDRAF